MRTFATRHRWWTRASAVGVIALLFLAVPTRATAQTIVSNGWEDGTTQGWVPRGSVTLTSTTEAFATGARSLKTTGRTASWNGPSLNLLPLLTPGTIYQLRISARLVAPQSPTQLAVTVQRTTADGTSYDRVAATTATGATDAGWVTLQGTYSVPFCVTGLVVYIESASATASFYVDDFSITVVPLVACDPADPTGIHTNFETGTTQGWGPRGGVTLSATNADSHTGAYSLLTTGRTASWQGPTINAAGRICSGGRYSVSVWVKLAPGQPDSQIRVSIQRGLGSDTSYITVLGNRTVTAAEWVQLSGNYDFGLSYTSLSMYVESSTGTASFYIDDFDLTPTGLLPPIPPPYCPPGPPIATGLDKFLGCAYSNSQKVNLAAYWNQVTPENGGKWGTVEGTRDVMSWGEMDAAYALAKAKGFPVKLHTLIWGSQQPSWMASLPEAEQLAEIQEWFQAAAARYPALDQVEVVNEPLHQPPAYMNALGGSGVTGWDWVLTAFRMARTYFPSAQLLINEYSVTNSTADMERYIAIIKLLQKENLIGGVGVQGHYFSTRQYFPGSAALQMANLDLLAQTGLPIYVTEMDIDGPTDEAQLADYQWIFPIYWDHPAVKGITMWGYRPGMWRTPQGAHLAYENGAERPAFVWLQEYVKSDVAPVVASDQRFRIDGGTCNVIGKVEASDADTATHPAFGVLQGWEIDGGSGEAVFAIDPATGVISIASPLDIDFARTSYEIAVSVSDGFRRSEPRTVTITILRKIDVVHNGHAISIAKEAVPAHLREHGDCLGTSGIR